MKGMEMKFYVCDICGQTVAMVEETGADLICCGEKMRLMTPNTVDASIEKHVPVVEYEDDKIIVTVGSLLHPMTDAHYIKWIAIQTQNGNQRKQLKPNDEPKVCFNTCPNDRLIAVYAYCNLHGLWKA